MSSNASTIEAMAEEYEYSEYDDMSTEDEDPCEEPVVDDLLYVSVLFLLSVTLTIILTFTTRRNARCPACCNGNGGFLLSVNFLENKTSRGMIVAAFVLTTFDILDMINELGNIGGIPRILKVLMRLSMVGIFNLIFLPLFHCISVNTLLRQCLGLLFVLVTIPLMLGNATSVCSFSVMSWENIIQQFIEYVVVGIATVFLIYKFIYRIVTAIQKTLKSYQPKSASKDPYQVEYMKNLLRKDLGEAAGNDRTFTHRIRKYLYKNLPGFRFSISIQTSITLGALLFVLVISKGMGVALDLYTSLSMILEMNRASLNETMPNVIVEIAKFLTKSEGGDITLRDISMAELFETQLNTIFSAYFIAASLAGVQVVCTIVYMLRAYRSNVLSLYHQELDDSAIKGIDNVSLVVGAMQFAGYQVAHMIWGYFVQFSVFFILLLLFAEFIIIPIIFEYWGVILYIVDWLIPMLIVMFLSKFIQRTLVKRAFLVDRGNVFGLDNRKCFFNMMFFMFYYNLFVGLISCFMRVIKVALIGVWFFPRLDMSIFPHSFEKFDSGYKAYICLLRLEERQNNVILLTFIDLLNERYKTIKKDPSNDFNLVDQNSPAVREVRRNQARNRWFVAYTLIHNESLRSARRRFRKETPAIICHSTVL